MVEDEVEVMWSMGQIRIRKKGASGLGLRQHFNLVNLS